MFLLGLSAYLSVGAVFAAFSLDRHFRIEVDRSIKLSVNTGSVSFWFFEVIALFFFYPVFCVIWLLKEKEA